MGVQQQTVPNFMTTMQVPSQQQTLIISKCISQILHGTYNHLKEALNMLLEKNYVVVKSHVTQTHIVTKEHL